MSEPKTYTTDDIERYHSGGLTAAERHALERAALADPFLADALEGYAFTQTPSADVSALQQKLQVRIQKEEKRRGVHYLNNWMKIAAVLVVMAGGGWVVFQLFNPKEAGLALKQSPAARRGTLSQGAVDSATVSSDAPLTIQAPVSEPPKEALPKRAAQDNGTVRNAPAPAAQPPAGALSRLLPDSARAENNATALLQGRAAGVRMNKQTTGAASLNEERADAPTAFKKEAAAFDKDGRFVSPATDTIKNFNVTLNRTDLPASETVVLNNKAKEIPRARKMTVSVDSTEPVEGWTNFDDYIAGNLKEPEELKTKSVRGDVELSFDVNKEGEAVNIAVVKSLCDKCDEEAVRLLKEGPRWKKNKKKGKVKIKFAPLP